MNRKYLWGACILAGALMLKAGAPVFTVVAGIFLVVIWQIWKNRTASL